MIKILYSKKFRFDKIKDNENNIHDLHVFVCLNVLLEEFNYYKDS